MITSWWSMCRWLYSFKLNNNVLVCFFSFSFSFGIFHKYSQDALSSQKPVAAIFYFLFFFLCLPSLHQNFVYRYSIIRAFFFFLFLSRLKSSIHHYSLPLYVYSLIIIKTFFFFLNIFRKQQPCCQISSNFTDWSPVQKWHWTGRLRQGCLWSFHSP